MLKTVCSRKYYLEYVCMINAQHHPICPTSSTNKSSQHLEDERVFQSLSRGNSFLRVKRQTTIQQIGEQGQVFGFHLGEALGRGHKASSEITAWFGKCEGLDRVLPM